MVGVRTILFSGLVVLAVALSTTSRQERLDLDWVDAGKGLRVMRHEVTRAQWKLCVDDGACSHQPKAANTGPNTGPNAGPNTGQGFPVTGIGALDAQEFVAWAGVRSGLPVRLPTLDEWYGFSNVIPAKPQKIFTDPRLAWAATYGSEGKVDPVLKPSGHFGRTPAGVADVRGNVWEWTSTCVTENGAGRCPAYVAAGEHEAKVPLFIRDPAEGGCATGTPPAHLGLRLVTEDIAQ